MLSLVRSSKYLNPVMNTVYSNSITNAGSLTSQSMISNNNHINILFNQVRFATKKSAGGSKNKSGPGGKRLGLKIRGGHEVKAGAVLIRQRGSTYWHGDNVGVGRDFTLFALKPGVVAFHQVKRLNGRVKTVVSVLTDVPSPSTIAAAKAIEKAAANKASAPPAAAASATQTAAKQVSAAKST